MGTFWKLPLETLGTLNGAAEFELRIPQNTKWGYFSRAESWEVQGHRCVIVVYAASWGVESVLIMCLLDERKTIPRRIFSDSGPQSLSPDKVKTFHEPGVDSLSEKTF